MGLHSEFAASWGYVKPGVETNKQKKRQEERGRGYRGREEQKQEDQDLIVL